LPIVYDYVRLIPSALRLSLGPSHSSLLSRLFVFLIFRGGVLPIQKTKQNKEKEQRILEQGKNLAVEK
jgi:hypothetical protein